MTKLTLILTLKDPHDAKPDPKRLLRRVKMLKCCPRLGFEPGMSNVEKLKDRANTLTSEPLLLFQDYCISTRIPCQRRTGMLDLGVDPNKSTWVDLRTSSRVGSVLPGAVDSKSNLELKSDFTASRLEIDLN